MSFEEVTLMIGSGYSDFEDIAEYANLRPGTIVNIIYDNGWYLPLEVLDEGAGHLGNSMLCRGYVGGTPQQIIGDRGWIIQL
jgi:hypothetical protein